jgi:hypothetical protein
MEPVYTVRTTRGFGQNIKSSLSAALLGVMLFVGSFFLLSWNEGNSVKTHAALDWAEASLVSTPASPLDRAQEGKVVYVTGSASTTEELGDREFGVTGTGLLRLKRKVEMYQWEEKTTTNTREKIGGGTETTTDYKYNKTWSERAIDSARFHMASQFKNPPMPVSSKIFEATNAMLGDYHLTIDLLSKLENFSETLTPPPTPGYQLNLEQLYKGNSPQDPQVGDLRISFTAVPAGPVSVIGQQRGNKIVTARAPTQRDVLLVENATVEAAVMLENAHKEQTIITWVLRLVGFIVMAMGLRMIMMPLSALMGVLPPLRWIFDFGVGVIAFGVALILSAGTIAIAWLAYRPLFSALLFGGAAFIALGVWMLKRPQAITPQAAISGDGQAPIITRG